MPDDSGWYWVETDGLTKPAWAMAYLDVQCDEIELMVCQLQRRSFAGHVPGDTRTLATQMSYFRFNHDLKTFRDEAGYGAFMPTQWAGPLLDPNDEFASMECQFNSETHDQASEKNHAMVGIVVDRTYCSRFASFASSYVTIPAEETEGLIGKFWQTLDEQAADTKS
jgi:hypothetical protein